MSGIITISREYGAGGHSIAKRVAAELGIEIYDRDIIRDTVKDSGLDTSVIEREEELDQLDFSRPIYLFSQTTKSVEGFQSLVKAIEARRSLLRNKVITSSREDYCALFEYHDTICRSVANRVAQLQAFAKAQDLVIFVGGGKSSNAKVLYNHCLEANPKTIFVSSQDELEDKLAEYGLKEPVVTVSGAGLTVSVT